MDRRRGLVVLGAIVLLAAAATAATPRKTVTVGERTTVSAEVQNPLEISDVLTVRFDGEAVKSRSVDVRFPPNTARRICFPERNVCRLTVPPQSSAEMTVTLEGVSPARQTMMVRVSSMTTGKQASGEMLVIVAGETAGEAWNEFAGFLRDLFM